MEHSILIIDNDIEHCDTLFTIFDQLNYDVAMACDPPTARYLLLQRPYDLALLDLHLDDDDHLDDDVCDGIALFRQLSAIYVPFCGVLATSEVTSKVCREASLSGITSVLGKPVDYPWLIRIVARTLAGAPDMKRTTAPSGAVSTGHACEMISSWRWNHTTAPFGAVSTARPSH